MSILDEIRQLSDSMQETKKKREEARDERDYQECLSRIRDVASEGEYCCFLTKLNPSNGAVRKLKDDGFYLEYSSGMNCYYVWWEKYSDEETK